MDGTLDIWDIIFKQTDPSLSIQVTDDPLYSMRIHDNGRFIVTGSQDGTTTLIELSDNLCTLQVYLFRIYRGNENTMRGAAKISSNPPCSLNDLYFINF